MSALRKLITVSVSEADGRLSRAAVSVEKRETKLVELRERLAALTAADKRGDDEDNVIQVIVVKREIAQAEEELSAYREAQSRAQKLRDEAIKEAEHRAEAARQTTLRKEAESVGRELVETLTRVAVLAGRNEAIIDQITGPSAVYSLFLYAEAASKAACANVKPKTMTVFLGLKNAPHEVIANPGIRFITIDLNVPLVK